MEATAQKEIKAYTNIPYGEQEKNEAYRSQFMNDMREMQVGFGSQVLRADQQGLWLGAKDFASAPFSVDMEGNVTASSVTLTGYVEEGGSADDINNNATTVSGGKLTAGSVVASKLSVSQLSAISADVGSITAGTITGVLFRTASSGERIEIDTTNTNQIRFYDSSTLYGVLEVDRVGSDGYIRFKTDDGNGIDLDTGVGASGFNSSELSANGGTFSTNGNASNGTIAMYANGASDYFGINRSAGTYKLITDLRIDADWLPQSSNTYDLGSSTYPWQKLWAYDGDFADDVQIDGDLTVDDDVDIGDNLTVADNINITEGFLNLSQMSGSTASGLTSQDGSMYYRTDDDVIRVKLNGSWVTVDTS